MQPFNLAQFSKAQSTTTTLGRTRIAAVDDLLGNAPNLKPNF